MAKEDKGKEQTIKQLQAELAKLTKATDVILRQNVKDKEAAKEVIDGLKKKLDQEKEQAKKQREDSTAKTISKIRALIKASKHHWVQVFHKGLKDGVDFSFNYEGLQYKLYSGKPVNLSEIIINHLKSCRRPQTKLEQGETGGAPKMTAGWYNNFAVVNCEKPETVPVKDPEPAMA